MIDQTQYQAEITRLGFTMESINTLFQTKMEIFNTFVDKMKEMIFTSMIIYFSRVEGFTQEMQQVVFKIF
jgi:hypothetical protein